MDEALDFANLFVDNEAGELLYFLITVSLSLGALLIAFDQRARSQREPEAGRYVWALAGVVAAWGILTIGNLYILLVESANPAAVIPPLERATSTIVLLLITYAFLTADLPRPDRFARFILIVLIALIGAGYAFTVLEWGQEPNTTEFNRHSLGLAWTFIPIVLALGGSVALLTRYQDTADIPLKLLFFLVIAGGHGYTLAQMSRDNLSGNEVGTVRLAMLIGLSIVPIVVYRLVIERFREAVGEITGMMPAIAVAPTKPQEQKPPQDPGTEAQREALSLLKILGLMLESTNPHAIPRQIAQAVAKNFSADVVAVASVNDPNWADIIAAYNFIYEREIPGLALNLANQETMASSIELNIQSVLLPTRNAEEILDLFNRLDAGEAGPHGPAYFQPLSRERQVVGMLVLAMPYTGRQLTNTQRTLLEALAPLAARLLLVSREAIQSEGIAPSEDVISSEEEPPKAEDHIRTELQTQLETTQGQVEELNVQVQSLKDQLAQERQKLTELAKSSGEADNMSITQKINMLSTERQRLQDEREGLVNALQEAKALMTSATADKDEQVYQQMIDTLQAEKRTLMTEKQKLERELSELRGAAPQDRERLQDVVNQLVTEKKHLQEEHQKLKSEVSDAQQQLSTLGIEGGLIGFSQMVAHLTEERNRFLNQSKRVMAERDHLLKQLFDLEEQRLSQKEHTNQLTTLQKQLKRLAQDREAVLRQRDALKVERDELNQQREAWINERVELTEKYETLRRQVEKLQASLKEDKAPRLSDTQVTALEQRVNEVEEDRSNIEFQLHRAQEDIKLLEQELERVQHELDAAQGAPVDPESARMIVDMVQELRTPLTSILGYNELLLNETAGILGETQKQFLLRIQVNVEQLMAAIEDLVRVMSMDYGKLLLSPRKIDVQDLIDDAITHSSAQYREKGLTLELDIAPDIPPILADRDAMQQILTRLLGNAYLASPADNAVRVAAHHQEDYELNGATKDVVYIAITDQGGGIPEEDHERVFMRHYRSDNPLIEGLGDKGAGLSVAKALVTSHGGEIWLTTETGESTTFHVIIPVDHTFGEGEIQRGNVSRLIDALEGDEPISQ